MNTEFVKDLIDALRADPEHFKDLLLSNALADIMQSLMSRVLQVEQELMHYQQMRQRDLLDQHKLADDYRSAAMRGVSPQQWHGDLMNRLQQLELVQRQAQMLEVAHDARNNALIKAGHFVEYSPPEASLGYAAALKRVLGMKGS
jgi:hypothetical protein